MTKPKASPSQSWDDMLAEVATRKTRTEVIQGVTVRVPTETTLRFELKLDALADSGDEDDLRMLVRDLYGDDVFDQWVENGMTPDGFQAAMGWGLAQAKGRTDFTFLDAMKLVLERKENPPQAAANRATRRAAASTPRSKSTGTTSKRTSAASTASTRRRSSTSPGAPSPT